MHIVMRFAIAGMLYSLTTILVFAQQNKYWVGKALYQNDFNTAADLAQWQLVEDNGTGSWTLSGSGSAILKMDGASGGYSNRLFNISGANVPRLLPLDKANGKIQYQVIALTGGTQYFYIQVQEFNAAGTLIADQDIQDPQSAVGFYTIDLNNFSWDPATTQIRFIIAGENGSSQQGTIELNYFSYYNQNVGWSNTANWSSTSGGVGGAGLPALADNVYFDNNSISNAFIDIPVSIANITLQPTFKAGLVQAGSNTVTVTGNSYLGGGFLVGATADLYVNNVTVDGTQYTSTSGTIHIGGNLVYISGNFYPSNGTMNFVSDNPQTIPVVGYNNLSFNGTGVKTAAGNFSVAGNFINNSNFNAAGYSVVFKGSTQIIAGSSVTNFYNLTIVSPASLLLASPQNLTNVLTIQPGASLNANGNLTLIATSPTVTASIANLTGATLTGNVTIQKYIYSSQRIYRYLSSPVSNAFVSGWQSGIPITGTFLNPSTGPGISSDAPSMYLYTESVAGSRDNGYTNYPSSGLSNVAALTRGKGYAIYVRDNAGRPQVVSLKGAPYKGNISIPVTYTSTSGGASEDGWNLVGNPYPSSIDWSLIDVSDRINMDNAIYYLDNNNASPVYRSFVNGVGVNCVNGIISSSQGFWVKANASFPSLSLHEIHKTTTAPSFYREALDKQLVRLTLDSVHTFLDETVIRLEEGTSTSFDSEFDAYKLYDKAYPALGSSQKGSPLLSINTLSTNSTKADTITLFTHIVKPGNYTLSVSEYSIESGTTPYLLDLYTNSKRLIHSSLTYAFTVNDAQLNNTDRFKIMLYPSITTSLLLSTSDDAEIAIFPNPAGADTELSLTYPKANNEAIDIAAYDMTGHQIMLQKTVHSTDEVYTFQLPASVKNGIYNIVVQYKNTSIGKKIIIK